MYIPCVMSFVILPICRYLLNQMRWNQLDLISFVIRFGRLFVFLDKLRHTVYRLSLSSMSKRMLDCFVIRNQHGKTLPSWFSYPSFVWLKVMINLRDKFFNSIIYKIVFDRSTQCGHMCMIVAFNAIMFGTC